MRRRTLLRSVPAKRVQHPRGRLPAAPDEVRTGARANRTAIQDARCGRGLSVRGGRRGATIRARGGRVCDVSALVSRRRPVPQPRPEAAGAGWLVGGL